MKTIQLLMIILLGTSSNIYAQGGNKLDQAKIAFISQKLSLTSAEAEKFWPIYNEFRTKSKEIKKGRRGDIKEMMTNENIGDKEADEILSDFLVSEQKLLDLKKEYFAKLKLVIPAKKIISLLQAEKDFNKELISYIKK